MSLFYSYGMEGAGFKYPFFFKCSFILNLLSAMHFWLYTLPHIVPLKLNLRHTAVEVLSTTYSWMMFSLLKYFWSHWFPTLVNTWTVLRMKWFGFFNLLLSVFMQVFSDVKLLGVVSGPKILITVFSNQKEARILGNEWNRWINFAHYSSFLQLYTLWSLLNMALTCMKMQVLCTLIAIHGSTPVWPALCSTERGFTLRPGELVL